MPEILILTSKHEPTAREDACVVVTPLDAIERLENRRASIVILAGSFARNRELAAFLRDFYPGVQVEREA